MRTDGESSSAELRAAHCQTAKPRRSVAERRPDRPGTVIDVLAHLAPSQINVQAAKPHLMDKQPEKRRRSWRSIKASHETPRGVAPALGNFPGRGR
jgi:hypothetical protein